MIEGTLQQYFLSWTLQSCFYLTHCCLIGRPTGNGKPMRKKIGKDSIFVQYQTFLQSERQTCFTAKTTKWNILGLVYWKETCRYIFFSRSRKPIVKTRHIVGCACRLKSKHIRNKTVLKSHWQLNWKPCQSNILNTIMVQLTGPHFHSLSSPFLFQCVTRMKMFFSNWPHWWRKYDFFTIESILIASIIIFRWPLCLKRTSQKVSLFSWSLLSQQSWPKRVVLSPSLKILWFLKSDYPQYKTFGKHITDSHILADQAELLSNVL